MHIHLAIVGFNRASSFTLNSIRRKLIRPAKREANVFSVSVTMNFARERVVNPRSGEDGFTELRVPTFMSGQSLRLFEQSEVDRKIAEIFLKAKENGNAWPEDNFNSLHNALRFLHVLRESYEQIPADADVVVFMRPDLKILDRLKIRDYLVFPHPFMVTPAWHRWGGTNDRVSIMSRKVAAEYFCRLDVLDSFLDSGNVFHSEKFLTYAMTNVPDYPVIRERFQRIRLGGLVQKEDFSK